MPRGARARARVCVYMCVHMAVGIIWARVYTNMHAVAIMLVYTSVVYIERLGERGQSTAML